MFNYLGLVYNFFPRIIDGSISPFSLLDSGSLSLLQQ